MPMSIEQLTELIRNKLPDALLDIEDLRGDQNHYHAFEISPIRVSETDFGNSQEEVQLRRSRGAVCHRVSSLGP